MIRNDLSVLRPLLRRHYVPRPSQPRLPCKEAAPSHVEQISSAIYQPPHIYTHTAAVSNKV